MLDLSDLQAAIRHEGGVSRRLFLAYSASLSAIPLLGQQAVTKTHKPKHSAEPFGVGIASGDPTPDGVVLWTRLAPNPLEPKGGMVPESVEVTWEVATDDAMRHVVRSGTAIAAPELAHSVHVEVDGLAPDRWYWYRFRSGDAESPIGRTRTMPSAEALPGELRLAVASCQHYEAGLYTAYEHMAKDELDLVLHLGDYIYEKGAKSGAVRKHIGKHACETLAEYRVRHSQYKTDPLLQAMHRRCPWVVTWDDHEVQNDYANDISEDLKTDPAKFLTRRANAYQAYYEMMPLRRTSLPRGPEMQLYRSVSFGRLANFLMLDGRQYRTDQPNGGAVCDMNEACKSPRNSMLGQRQFAWVENELTRSPAKWNTLAQQVLMAIVDRKEGEERLYDMDQWCGYVAERNKLMSLLHERKVANPVVLTGDIHSNWVNHLHVDDLREGSPVVATEFAGTSIASGGDGGEGKKFESQVKSENANVQFYNSERGYVRCTISPKMWTAEFRTVPQVSKPGAEINTRATFVIEAGEPGAKRA